MKNYKILYLILIIFPLLLNQSCLEMGLDEPPASNDAEITNINFEYRWEENGRLHVMRLDRTIVDTQSAKHVVDITVPDASENFPESVRNNVALNNLTAYCDISPGATIVPMGNSPQLGTIGNFSISDLKYNVIAADGTAKVWTIEIRNFNK